MGKVLRFKKRKAKKSRIQPAAPKPRREVWQAALVRMPTWVEGEDAGEHYRPWAGVAFSLTQDFVAGFKIVRPEERDPTLVVDALRELAEICGRWPDLLEVSDQALVEILETVPELSSTAVAHRPRLAGVDSVLRKMARDMETEGSCLPSAEAVPGVDAAQLGAFARAAVAFFEAAPWRELDSGDLIRIESGLPDPKLRYCSIMGAAGEQFGALFMEQVEDFAVMSDFPESGEFLNERVMWSLSYWEPPALDYREHDLWEDGGLPVIAGGLIPAAVCFGPKRRVRRASPKLLAFFESVLLALAETTAEDLDAFAWQKEIRTSAGTVTLAFSLVEWDEEDAADEFAHLPAPTFMERHLRRASARIAESGANVGDVLGQLELFDDDEEASPNPRERAQELAYDAMDARGRRRGVLARQALEIDPDCADALSVLGEDAPDLAQAVELFQKATDAAARKLGEEYFNEHVGAFWGMVETRPYMRARLSLAQVLAIADRRGEALQHYRELLRLNPDDNQGVRLYLVPELIGHGDLLGAEELLQEYKDIRSAEWRYSWALLSYLQLGDQRTSRRRLTEAFKCNPDLATLLLGLIPRPDVPPPYFKPGDISEAIAAAFRVEPMWSEHDEALGWLAERWERFDRG